VAEINHAKGLSKQWLLDATTSSRVDDLKPTNHNPYNS